MARLAIFAIVEKNLVQLNEDQHYKVSPLMQRPKSVAIYQKWLQ
jgi:hypothetical protein